MMKLSLSMFSYKLFRHRSTYSGLAFVLCWGVFLKGPVIGTCHRPT